MLISANKRKLLKNNILIQLSFTFIHLNETWQTETLNETLQIRNKPIKINLVI